MFVTTTKISAATGSCAISAWCAGLRCARATLPPISSPRCTRSLGVTTLAEHARQEAFDELCLHAEKVGANAVIAMRYDANEITPGVTEVLAYGTAVVVEKLPE